MSDVALLPLTETAMPADASAVADLLARAHAAGTPVYPFGGRTRLGYGVRPKTPGIGLSTAALSRVIDYPARDLTITVEAGLSIAALARQLAAERQRLPIDVLRAEEATVGGVIATNTFGPRRFRWGTIRDYLLGFSAVDGRGQAFAGGGRVVKNAAGYNMGRLMVGSLGTLAVLTQVTLMVRPLPETSALLIGDLADLDQAERLLAALVRTQSLPSALELVAGPAWQTLPDLDASAPTTAPRLLVGFEGTAAEVDWMVGEAQRQCHGVGVAATRAVRGDACDRLWQRLIDTLAARESSNGSSVVLLQAQVPPSRVTEAAKLLLQADPQASIQAHAGDGIVRAETAFPPGKTATQCRRLREAMASLDGTMIVAGHPAALDLTREAVWGSSGDARQVMAAIRRQFDPKGILNPGRFSYE